LCDAAREVEALVQAEDWGGVAERLPRIETEFYRLEKALLRVTPEAAVPA
jgi:hypothetical protein